MKFFRKYFHSERQAWLISFHFNIHTLFTMPIHFLLIDDDYMFLMGLKDVLLAGFPDAELTFAQSAQKVSELCETRQFDLALMDLELRDGSSTNRMLIQLHERKIKVMIISGTASPHQLRVLLGSGVLGYYDKLWSAQNLYSSIRAILDGNVGFPRVLFEGLGQHAQKQLPRLEDEEERAVLARFICDHSRSNKQIARLMDKSEAWVKGKLRNICVHLDVGNREQLIELLKEHHLIQEPDLSTVYAQLERLSPSSMAL